MEGSGERLVCVSTVQALEKEMAGIRQGRKEMRHDQLSVSASQREEVERQRTIIERIEQRRSVLGDSSDILPIPPESAAQRMSYGVRKQHAPTLTEDRMLLEDPEQLLHAPDMDEAEAIESQKLYRRTHGLDNFASHFLAREHFAEKRPPTTAAARRLSEQQSQPTFGSPSLAARLKKALTPKMVEETPEPGGVKRKATDEAKGQRSQKKARAKSTAPAQSAAVTHAQMAVADMVGMRELTREEMITATHMATMEIKLKPRRGEYSIPTEAAPAGNESVRSIERDCLTETTFNAQAVESSDPRKASLPADRKHVLAIPTDDRLPTTPLVGTEMRHVAVVEPKFFALSDVQSAMLTKGQRKPLEAAQERRLPSLLPPLPIESREARAAEQGRPEFLSDEPALRNEIGAKTREFLSPEKPTVRQPLVLYLHLFTKPSANKGWREEIVFDRRTKLNAMITQFDLYLRDEEAAFEEDRAAYSADTGFKTLTKISRQNARNVKKKRDNVGRKAEFEPSRLRMRFGHYKVRFFLRRLIERDILFRGDWPLLEGGKEMRMPSSRTVMPVRRTATEITKLCTYGAIGRILDRHRKRIEDRGRRTGTRYMVSSEDLGSDRLHPTVNPDIPDVSLQYHLSYMEQPGPGELECIKGNNCFCYTGNVHVADQSTYFNLTSTFGFICKQFLLPQQELKWRMTGELPAERSMCIVDYILYVNMLYHMNIQREVRPTEPIINHCVRVGVEGEYAPEYMLQPNVRLGTTTIDMGVPAPFPKFDAPSFEHSLRRDPTTQAIIHCMRYRPGRMLF